MKKNWTKPVCATMDVKNLEKQIEAAAWSWCKSAFCR